MSGNDAIARALAQTRLAELLSTRELDELATYFSPSDFESGKLLVRTGEPATHVGLMLAGSADVVVGEVKVGAVAANELFGEAMFSDEATRTADLRASDSGAVATLNAEAFDDLLLQNRELALRARSFFRQAYAATRAKDERGAARDPRRFVALIAHNAMKPALIEFVRARLDSVGRHPIVATGTTGALLYRETGLVLSKKVESGPLGGDQAIGAMISTGNVRAVIFFRDPLSAHPHHADIEALGRLCDVYHIPFATNPSTAAAVLDHLDAG